jgi:putative spermidine/putrescine transport system ATP-binding protein
VAGFIGENNKLMGKVTAINGSTCTVELEGGGGTVNALKVNVGAVGDRTTLSLRPERVTINPVDGASENACPSRVEELIYLGDHIRARLTVSGNSEFIVKVPNAQGHAILTVGDQVNVGWATEDCRALDA